MSTPLTPKEAAFSILFASDTMDLLANGAGRKGKATLQDYANAVGTTLPAPGLGDNWFEFQRKHAGSNWHSLRMAARDWMIANVIVTRQEPSVDDGMVVTVNPPRMPS